MSDFTKAKQQFDDTLGTASILPVAYVPVDGKPKSSIRIRNAANERLEEYYKWQFIYALIYSGLYAKDYIGVEIRFPKGNKNAAPLRMDGAIFDDASWLKRYTDFWKDRKSEDLEWLNEHLLAVIEFKKGDKEIEKVVSGQVRPAMKEKDPAGAYVLGIYYDEERLYLFHRRDGLFLRYDEAKNQKGADSKIGDLSLHLPDPYLFVPSFQDLIDRVHVPEVLDRSNRTIAELDMITSIATVQVQTALSNVLRALDRVNLVNQAGYRLLIETFAMKIFDEKRNERSQTHKLDFYVTDEEAGFSKLSDRAIQGFVHRMSDLLSDAKARYEKILSGRAIDWKNANHVQAVVAVCLAFQDFSFVRSSTSDLYQLVSNNFASAFMRAEAAQFLTPLPIIRFLVQVVNPRNGDSVFDPCCGIGDFLSLSFVHAQEDEPTWTLDDANIYGVDRDENMIVLATLNMLLNGDGEAKLFHTADKGSILYKVDASNPPQLVELLPEYHKNGRWDDWPDATQLRTFDVVLTNPPFGDDRAYRPTTTFDRKVIEMYETWHLSDSDKIDLGVVF